MRRLTLRTFHWTDVHSILLSINSLKDVRCVFFPFLHALSCLCVASARAQGRPHSEDGPWLVGSSVVQAVARSHRVPSVLLPSHACQTRAKEAQDRGPISRTLQETQHRHGEQDHATAAEGRRTGTTLTHNTARNAVVYVLKLDFSYGLV